MRSGPVVVGVDPGGRHTGMVVRQGTRLLEFRVVDADPDERVGWVGIGDLPAPQYVERVLDQVEAWRREFAATVAVESVVRPGGFARGKRHPLNPGDLIGVSAVGGALVGRFVPHGLVFVPPRQNGQGALTSYPPALVGAREVKGTGRLSHARSAWDVAGTAAHLIRTEVA